MYTIRERMPRPKPEGPVKTFQFRMSGEVARRWLDLFDKAKKRNPYLDESDFNKRLVGLTKDLDGSVPEADVAYFRQAGQEKAKLIGRAASGKPHIREVSPKVKRK